MDTKTLLEWSARYHTPNYGRAPIVLTRGDGVRVWDSDGREYLDFGAGLAVASLGHCHPRVTGAIQEAAATLLHVSNLYHAAPQIQLARLLVEHSFADLEPVTEAGEPLESGPFVASLPKRSGHVLIVDGHVLEHVSESAGVTRLSDLESDPGLPTLLPVDHNKLTAAHAAFSTDGVMIEVKPGSVMESPLVVEVAGHTRTIGQRVARQVYVTRTLSPEPGNRMNGEHSENRETDRAV